MNTATYHTSTGYQTSERYSVVNTGNLVELIKGNTGYEMASYVEAGVRKKEKLGYQKHLVRLKGERISDELRPEIVIHNSYDKSSSLKIMVGFFRFVCCNGLIVGDMVDSFQTYHTGINYDALFEWCGNIQNRIETGFSAVQKMKQIQAAPEMMVPVVRKTLQIASPTSYDENTDWASIEAKWAVNTMLRPVRYQDKGDDLWTRFNVIQERVFKGGTGLRKVTNIDKVVKINRMLWNDCNALAA